jgi:hypothetical protein
MPFNHKVQQNAVKLFIICNQKKSTKKMKKNAILRFNVMIISLSLGSTFGFSQSTKETAQAEASQNEKKKIIKVQCMINGKIAPSNLAFGRKDTLFSLKTFPFYEQDRREQKELVVKEFEVSLIRDGKAIANQTIYGNGSIESLAAIAKNEDTYLIQIREVFEKTKDGNLKLYAKGIIKIAYLFYDLEVFKPTGNAISAIDVKK